MTNENDRLISDKRKEQGFTQDQLAQQLHVTRQAVSSWENGKTKPDESVIEELARLLGVKANQLFQPNEKMGAKKMAEQNEKQQVNYNEMDFQTSHADTAIGLFYALALFIGILIGVMFIYLNGFGLASIIFGVTFGLLGFLILGLLSHAIIHMTQK